MIKKIVAKGIDNYFENILKNLEQRNINTFVSYPNVDPGNQKLLKLIDKYKDNRNFIFYKNLEREIFMKLQVIFQDW